MVPYILPVLSLVSFLLPLLLHPNWNIEVIWTERAPGKCLMLWLEERLMERVQEVPLSLFPSHFQRIYYYQIKRELVGEDAKKTPQTLFGENLNQYSPNTNVFSPGSKQRTTDTCSLTLGWISKRYTIMSIVTLFWNQPRESMMDE